MLNTSKIAGIALAGAFAATGASAQGTYYGQYSSTYTTPIYGTTIYQAPTIDLGPIEQVQPNSTVQYVQPTTTYIQPATTSTYAPVTNYTTPSYAATPSYTTSGYVQPSFTTSGYVPSSYTTSGYVQPSFTTSGYVPPSYTQPTYTTPSYYAPYDATPRVRARLQRQRSRIRNAMDRGDLRQGERRKLRRKMRNIREQFHAYKGNDGVINQWEEAELMRKLDRQSRRIRRLANNNRVAGPYPYAY